MMSKSKKRLGIIVLCLVLVVGYFVFGKLKDKERGVLMDQHQTTEDWKTAVAQSMQDSGCSFDNATIPLFGIDQKNIKHSIEFESYFCKELGAGFASTTKWWASDGVIKYTNVYEGNNEPNWYDDAPGKINTFGNYWLLDGTTPEKVINGIIQSLPTSEQRKYCHIEKDESSNTYNIMYDEKIQDFATKDEPLWEICGEFGPTNGAQMFKKVGNVLLFLRLGQIIPLYDYQHIIVR